MSALDEADCDHPGREMGEKVVEPHCKGNCGKRCRWLSWIMGCHRCVLLPVGAASVPLYFGVNRVNTFLI